ncbi:hypothetical protein GCM10027266_11210 [Arenimonas alkanexedens]
MSDAEALELPALADDPPAQNVRSQSHESPLPGVSKTWTFSKSPHGWIHGVPWKRALMRRPIATNDPGAMQSKAKASGLKALLQGMGQGARAA